MLLRTAFAASLLGLVALVVPAAAQAQVCVTVDTTRDTLPEPERRAAATLLSQALTDHRQQVVASGCVATYTVYHLRFGNAVTIHLTGPQGSRQATASRLEDVPPLYDQLVRSLFYGAPLSSSNNTVTRNNVTAQQVAPNRVGADSLWYLRLGPGLVAGSSLGTGPSFGFGYRYELDSIGIDASFLNLTVPTDEEDSDFSASGSLIKLMGLYFFNPIANHSPYVGAGVSYGMGGVMDDGRTYDGAGLQGELSFGYELLRASTIRIFAQLDGTLPFYTVKTNAFSSPTASRDSRWAPTVVFSFGVGWGRGRSVVVRQL